MPPKRRRADQAEEQPQLLDEKGASEALADNVAAQPAAAGQDIDIAPAGVDPAGSGVDRREDMRSLARRRAAHFAHFKDEGADDDDSNVHTGSNAQKMLSGGPLEPFDSMCLHMDKSDSTVIARTLGPWSSAVELVNAREQAVQDREDNIMKLARKEEEESTSWEPSRDLTLGPYHICVVPALSERCMSTITQHIECVESLEGVPDAIRSHIAPDWLPDTLEALVNELAISLAYAMMPMHLQVKLATAVCSGRKMSAEAAAVFADKGARDLVLTDCTQLDTAAMVNIMQLCVSPILERLELVSCGRGFGDEATAVMLKAGPLLLMDSLVLGALQAAPSLTVLAIPHASRLSGLHIQKLPSLLPLLRRLNLQGCQGIDKDTLISALPSMAALCCLTLDKIAEVDDAVVKAAGNAPALHSLSINLCQLVTDKGVADLATARPDLQQLQMDDCLKITDASLVSLHTTCKSLRLLSLRRCAKLTDEALAALVSHGTMTTLITNGVLSVGNATMRALAQNCHELECLDISFCRRVHDSALGLVADSCPKLRRVVCFGCSQISKTFFHGHSNLNLVGNILGTGSSCV